MGVSSPTGTIPGRKPRRGGTEGLPVSAGLLDAVPLCDGDGRGAESGGLPGGCGGRRDGGECGAGVLTAGAEGGQP
ncbi:hypothetical protein ALMP_59600 [Streptomyces sp. A012304]|nr:hypothetical protein ALMP_59600 [Streptomyces sp. A012304]